MKEEIINSVIAVYNALNNITVCGKNNLANLSGSIAALEEIADALNKAEITEASADKEDGKTV